MRTHDFDIGIIGGGAAGLTVAAGAAQLGARTLLIEKEKELGGDCLHYGCVPSKTLIRTAHVHQLMKSAHRFGLPSPDIPPVDYPSVTRRIQSVIARIQKHDSEERFCNMGVRIEFGEPNFTDSHSVSLNGKAYSARTWVLSTGSSPAVPPLSGLDRTPYITNREIFSLKRLPESMIVLGAGPVAVEMAQAFNRLGTRVTVVQRSGQILSREDRDLSDDLMEVLSGEGVEFYLRSTVLETRDLSGIPEVTIRRNGEAIVLKAEVVLVATGRSANLEAMGLEAIGVEYDRKGLKTDRRLRTTRKHIYGAGDVTGRYLFTHTAGYEGGIVVANAVFRIPRRVDYSLVPWCTYTDPELAGIGMNEKTAAEAGMPYSVITEYFRDNDRSLAEGYDRGRIKLILDESEKPLGVQILGPRAGELINEWVGILNGRVKLSTLATATHPYPTLGEINKRTAGTYLYPKIFSQKVRKGLKFFFHLKGRACG